MSAEQAPGTWVGSSCCCPLCLGEDDANESRPCLSQTEQRGLSGGRSPGVAGHREAASLARLMEAAPLGPGLRGRAGAVACACRVRLCVASLGFGVTALSGRGVSAWGEAVWRPGSARTVLVFQV